MKDPKMHPATKAVLRAFLEDPTKELYGLEVCKTVGLAPGTVQPILMRFEGIEWLESHWEDVPAAELGRQPRRYYRLTRDGAELAKNALVRAEQRALRRGGSLKFRPSVAGSEG